MPNSGTVSASVIGGTVSASVIGGTVRASGISGTSVHPLYRLEYMSKKIYQIGENAAVSWELTRIDGGATTTPISVTVRCKDSNNNVLLPGMAAGVDTTNPLKLTLSILFTFVRPGTHNFEIDVVLGLEPQTFSQVTAVLAQ